MHFDELLAKVAGEPPRTLALLVREPAPEVLAMLAAQGGMRVEDLFRGATNGQREARFEHILDPPITDAALDGWRRRYPSHQLPTDLVALLRRANGIHLWADADAGRSYEGVAPIEEWDLARVKMYGPSADERLLDSRFVAISYHQDGATYVVLDVDSGTYFYMDAAGADLTSPIGTSADALLDWLWSRRIDPSSLGSLAGGLGGGLDADGGFDGDGDAAQ
jgi:hypothetical protein